MKDFELKGSLSVCVDALERLLKRKRAIAKQVLIKQRAAIENATTILGDDNDDVDNDDDQEKQETDDENEKGKEQEKEKEKEDDEGEDSDNAFSAHETGPLFDFERQLRAKKRRKRVK